MQYLILSSFVLFYSPLIGYWLAQGDSFAMWENQLEAAIPGQIYSYSTTAILPFSITKQYLTLHLWHERDDKEATSVKSNILMLSAISNRTCTGPLKCLWNACHWSPGPCGGNLRKFSHKSWGQRLNVQTKIG